jgi:phosphoribosyl 1,2-cyclic phosphodiesterase
MSELALVVRGCRGSMSVSGADYRRYGGNTTCFEVAVSPTERLVIDAGTGLRAVQHDMGDGPHRITFALTHFHWDHIQGLPVFDPLFRGSNTVAFHGPAADDGGVEASLGGVIRPPWFPVSLAEAEAEMSYHALDGPIRVGPLTITHAAGNHPQGVAAYRIDSPDRSVVVATDHEAGDPEADARIAVLAEGADVLLHDGQYTPEQADGERRGWGHSSWEAAVRAARAARVQRLVLTSHDPDRTDDGVDWIRGLARQDFPRTDAAYEGMRIEL